MKESIPFYQILVAIWRKWTGIFLINPFFRQECNSPVQVMQAQPFCSANCVIVMPQDIKPVGPGYYQPMKNGKKNRPLHIKRRKTSLQCFF
jgi:hypothetical protein